MRYLYLSSDDTGAVCYPCDDGDLRHALRNCTEDRYLGTWPTHGHGPEWHMWCPEWGVCEGTLVVDLSKGGALMSVQDLKDAGVWPGFGTGLDGLSLQRYVLSEEDAQGAVDLLPVTQRESLQVYAAKGIPAKVGVHPKGTFILATIPDLGDTPTLVWASWEGVR